MIKVPEFLIPFVKAGVVHFGNVPQSFLLEIPHKDEPFTFLYIEEDAEEGVWEEEESGVRICNQFDLVIFLFAHWLVEFDYRPLYPLDEFWCNLFLDYHLVKRQMVWVPNINENEINSLQEKILRKGRR